MLVAGGNDVLRERRPGQVKGAMRIREYSGPFRRSDLKSRVAEPFDHDRGRAVGSDSKDFPLDHFELMAKTQRAAGEGRR